MPAAAPAASIYPAAEPVAQEKVAMQEQQSTSPSGPERGVALASRAWLRRGPKGMFGRVEAGFLIAQENGSISFVTSDRKVFDAGRAELRVTWPWWELGAGVHISVSGKIYRLSLTRPPNASDADPSGVAELLSMPGALSSGRAWRNHLAPPV